MRALFVQRPTSEGSAIQIMTEMISGFEAVFYTLAVLL